MSKENITGYKLLVHWMTVKKAFQFEMNTENLTKLIESIGYKGDNFQSSIDNFLSDNPGAQEALVTWVTDNIDHVREWKESLIECVGLPDKEEEEEELPEGE